MSDLFSPEDIESAKRTGEHTLAKDVYSKLYCRKANNIPTWVITFTESYSSMLYDLSPVVFSEKFINRNGCISVKIRQEKSTSRVYLLNMQTGSHSYIFSCDSEYNLSTVIGLLIIYGYKFKSKLVERWGFLYE